MRKASAILVAFLLSCSALFAQYEKGKPSIGIKTGLNISTFRTPLSYSDFNPSWDKAGFVAGAFVELPLNKRFSIQPEFLYSAMGSNVETDKGDTRYRFNYFSIPLVVKFKFAKAWRVLAGVQGDVLFRGRERMDYIDETVTVTDRTRDFDFGYTGGFEASISPRFTVMARYIHGIQDVSPTSNVNTAMNQAVQATVNFYLCKPGAKKAKK
ncbi:PorT family protein [Nostoc ellipsosporum NOK]|jgi:hypothetical protein|nr:PorT family protein [Nostoc ellipsosporum NOK]